MSIPKIQDVLMRRDGLTQEEADERVQECADDLRERLAAGDCVSPFDICAEYFGLEPDYLDQLI